MYCLVFVLTKGYSLGGLLCFVSTLGENFFFFKSKINKSPGALYFLTCFSSTSHSLSLSLTLSLCYLCHSDYIYC